MLEANQWILLNALTYKIHRMKDFDEMRLYLIQQLRYMIDFDAASFYISNPAKPRELIRPIGYEEGCAYRQQHARTGGNG